MNTETLTIVELSSRNDPLLLPWLDLYETAFPPTERVLVSRVLHALDQIEQGLGGGRHIEASCDADGRLTGLLDTFEPPALEAGFLWYLAVIPALRGQGLGARL
jgi:GNAT superfamily N-acetyltransferase